MPIFRLGCVLALAIAVCSVAAAQQSEREQDAPASAAVSPTPSSATPIFCNPWTSPVLGDQLSFGQRSCLQIAQLASPGLLLEAGLAASWAHWRNVSSSKPQDSEEFTRRLANYYARRTAQAGAELLVGYLHHEDPRYRPRGQIGGWRRTRAALLSVLESPDRDGNARPALAPVAGAFGWGFTAVAVDLHHNSVDKALLYTGAGYSHYFVSAVLHEFSPELRSLMPHFIRKFTSNP